VLYHKFFCAAPYEVKGLGGSLILEQWLLLLPARVSEKKFAAQPSCLILQRRPASIDHSCCSHRENTTWQLK
jgi:hypothetical protein